MSSPIDRSALSAFAAEKLGEVSVDLEPIDVDCAWPVFKVRRLNGRLVFVKLTAREPAERTLDFLKMSAPSDFLPRPQLATAPDFAGYAVLFLEWKDAERVDAEKMSDAQAASLLEACVKFSQILRDYDGVIPRLAEGDSPRGKYNELLCYSLRHPIASRLIKPLLDIPKEERDYSGHTLVTIHGDFQPRNYGFKGENFAAIFDTDDLTVGLACEDLAYAFTERARKSELSSSARARLIELFLRTVDKSPWTKAEWLIAVNHARLTIAARRLEKRPNSIFIAFDIAHRDKPLARLVSALRNHHA